MAEAETGFTRAKEAIIMWKRWLFLAALVAGAGLISFGARAATPPDLLSSGGFSSEGACCQEGVPNVPPSQGCMLLHQVGPNEDLHILASYYYGDARAWSRIYELNRKTIRNPNRIKVGQVLRVDVPPCWVPRYNLQLFLQLEERRKAILGAPGEKTKEVKKKEIVAPKTTILEGGPAEAPPEGGPAKEKGPPPGGTGEQPSSGASGGGENAPQKPAGTGDEKL
jgi:hypothetical protein